MSDRTELEPLTIGEAFPPGDAAGEWVLVLSMAMNDLATLDEQIHAALDENGPAGGYFFRLLCATLRELWRLFAVTESNQPVARVVEGMTAEARDAYDDVRELFVRPEVSDHDPMPRSWAEQHLKDVRDCTFHYPRVGSRELRTGVVASSDEQARLRHDAGCSDSRLFEFADVIALQTGFGNITLPDDRKRFEEIVATAKDILRQLVPVVWSALGAYLREREIDPRRLQAEKPTQ